jgi:ferredoxin
LEIKIYYFSGTGNTLWSAKYLAALLGQRDSVSVEMFNIAACTGRTPLVIEADKVIVLFPAYAYGLPRMARRFLLESRIRSPYIAALVTYGTDPGGALAEVRRILKRKESPLSFSGRIPSVENYIPLFGAPPEKKIPRRLEKQKHATEAAAAAIAAKKANRSWNFRPLSGFISALFKKGLTVFWKYFKVDENCNGCGLCKKICPAGAITMQNNRPVFSPLCEHCQSCFNWCPQRSINFFRLTRAVPRYHHPEVSAAELQ